MTLFQHFKGSGKKHTLWVALLIMAFFFAGRAANQQPAEPPASAQTDTLLSHTDVKIIFKNIDNQKIRDCFTEVMARYEDLHDCEVTLVQGPIKSSTMQAKPVLSFSNLFSETRRYTVRLAQKVRDSDHLLVDEVPEDVLTGWFAHELGHLVDYQPFSNAEMIFYGIKYLVSETFKTHAEHAADYIAIRNGFREEIIATKRFILENDLVAETYKENIRKYYLPIEEAEVWDHKHLPGSPTNPDTKADL